MSKILWGNKNGQWLSLTTGVNICSHSTWHLYGFNTINESFVNRICGSDIQPATTSGLGPDCNENFTEIYLVGNNEKKYADKKRNNKQILGMTPHAYSLSYDPFWGTNRWARQAVGRRLE